MAVHLYERYNRLAIVANVVVPAVNVSPYTQITPDMLKTIQVPLPVAEQPVYQTSDQLVGKISIAPLFSDMPVLQAYAVEPSQFHLSPDPQLEVVSFPVSMPQAVGGRVRAGSRINIYRIEATATVTPAEALVAQVFVVDVRDVSGASLTCDSALGTTQQIVTIAAAPDVASQIIGLAAGQKGDRLWLSLAPRNGQ